MKALIFAAGLGTRLKPITDTMPKALVPICGKPLLAHVAEKLKSAGFGSIVINVHHFAEQIREYVAANGSFGIDVSFSDETDMLRETGGGIRHAAPLLDDGEPFLVHNVDILSNLDIEKFVGVHEKYAADALARSLSVLATLLVSDRKTQRYLLFNSDNNLAGWMNIKTGEVRSPYKTLRREVGEGAVFQLGEGGFDYEAFLKKYNLKKYAFDGAHVISPEIFALMKEWPEKFSIIDFYLEMCGRYDIKYYLQPGLEMIDVGKFDSLQAAEEMAEKLKKC